MEAFAFAGLGEPRWLAELYFRKIFKGGLTLGSLLFSASGQPFSGRFADQSCHRFVCNVSHARSWWSAPALQDCERSGSDHKIVDVFVRYASALRNCNLSICLVMKKGGVRQQKRTVSGRIWKVLHKSFNV
jgi:hypothetical protein